MRRSNEELWQRFQEYYTVFPSLQLAIDISRMDFDREFLARMEPRIQKAFTDMEALERGAIANPDEGRMVGHYWLRNPALAPTPAIRQEIEQMQQGIKEFAAQVHDGAIRGAGGPFKNILLIGIGGSALGPQFVSHALGHPDSDKMRFFCFDNTDPDGMGRVLAHLRRELGQTLCLVMSKSGATIETRNGMIEAQHAYRRAGLDFAAHAVAVTIAGSNLDKLAVQNSWLRRFPMWEWVGGRTSVLSAVGLLPAKLQGFDIEALLYGAKICDEITRQRSIIRNPAAQLALMWFHAGNGKGLKAMVVLPYKDRLELFSKYLQQLIMESVGKRLDLDGQPVNQGIVVFGNKGSTDQHSYVQQLIEGQNNFFVTFLEVLSDRVSEAIEVEKYVTSGDYLNSLFLGTRHALTENGRESITLTFDGLSPSTIGIVIALFERAVGLYASLINVNAYHQPGVESGKKATGDMVFIQRRIIDFLHDHVMEFHTPCEIAEGIRAIADTETVFKICEHLAQNPVRRIQRMRVENPICNRYAFV
jgi:glucose-6-phosphate isomerase